jgi:hypothetical protein
MKMTECFQKGLLKKTLPDRENALRSLELSGSNIEDAIYGLNFAIDEKDANAALDSAKEILDKIKIFIEEDK